MNSYINNIEALVRKSGRLVMKRHDMINRNGFCPFWIKGDLEAIERLDARIARARSKARRLAAAAPQDGDMSVMWGIIWPQWIKE